MVTPHSPIGFCCSDIGGASKSASAKIELSGPMADICCRPDLFYKGLRSTNCARDADAAGATHPQLTVTVNSLVPALAPLTVTSTR